MRVAARQLFRNPGFALIVIVTLALSIGANTAIFSLINALMLRSLPYPHPERLCTIYVRTTGPGAADFHGNIDGEKWELLRDNVPPLIAAVIGGTSGVNLRAGTHVEYVRNSRVSARYLDVLGLEPMLGRNFTADEDRPHGPKAAILSNRLWRNALYADRNVVGKAILLRGELYTVVGVLPRGVNTTTDADVYTDLQPSREGEGGGTNFDVIARLRDGATWQRANAEINRAWAVRAHRYEKANPGSTVTYYTVPLQKADADPLRPQVEGLMVASVLILFIACANLAGLALVRMLRRSSEVATRRALGASEWQIQKQFWSESLLLAFIGGIVAVGVAVLAIRGLLVLLPPDFLPISTIAVDGRVLAFTLGVALLSSVLFGMLPAFAARRADLRSAMPGRGVAGERAFRLRQALITGEVALTVMLLAAAGLLIRTLIHLQTLPPGFNPDGVLAAKVSLDDVRYHDPAAFRKLLAQSTAAMRRIPGVQSAAVGLTLPYERALNDSVTFSDGKEAGKTDGTDVVYVTPGYFRTLQMPLLAGRDFTDSDGPDSEHVAIVNRAFARQFYRGSNPVGRIINGNTRIVGEVSDVSVSSGLAPTAPLQTEQAIYIPAAQVKPAALSLIHIWMQPDWVVRTAGPVTGLSQQIQRALASADPSLPATGFYSMNDLMARTLAMQRVEVALLGIMAGLALLLSAIGMFALVANMIAQRTREIGIRMALGSTTGQVMTHISRAGIVAAGSGLALGLLFSAGALRVMRSLLFGVGIYDAPTLAGVVVALAVVTLLATALPTLKITRIDPARTLREE